jgi:hypothetical protein
MFSNSHKTLNKQHKKSKKLKNQLIVFEKVLNMFRIIIQVDRRMKKDKNNLPFCQTI